MPRETEKTNTERVQELYDSFAGGDMEAIRDVMAPDVELHMPKGIAGGGTFNGFDEIVENVLSVLGNEWVDVSVVPDRYVADGDTVVASHVERYLHRNWKISGIPGRTRLRFRGRNDRSVDIVC